MFGKQNLIQPYSQVTTVKRHFTSYDFLKIKLCKKDFKQNM